MEITLVYNDLYDKVSRSLSIIAKRMTDDKGNLLFKDITLGTREKEIIYDYFSQAIIDLSTELASFIEMATDDYATFPLALPSNRIAGMKKFIQGACESYCVSYALHSWFVITAPRLAEKYSADCQRQVNAVIRLVNNKKAPSPAGNIMATKTEVSKS